MSNATNASGQLQAAAIKRLIDELAVRFERTVEQRAQLRYPMNLPVDVCRTSKTGAVSHFCKAWALDVSLDGIGLLTTTQPPQHQFYISFEPTTGNASHIEVQRRQSIKLIDGIYRTGALFVMNDE